MKLEVSKVFFYVYIIKYDYIYLFNTLTADDANWRDVILFTYAGDTI